MWTRVQLGCLSILVVILLWDAGAPLAAAQTRSINWNQFDVGLVVQSDGSVDVTETQNIQFMGTFQQGSRLIPTDRVTSIDNVSVAEVIGGETQPYRASSIPAPNTFRTSSTSQGLEIDWSFAPTANSSRTFVVRYTAHGAVRVYSSGDQLQWKAIYADREGPVKASTITVQLPGDVAPDEVKTSFSLYTSEQASRVGALPSSGTGQQVEPRTITFTLGQLPASTGAEVRVQFPSALVSASAPPWQAAADRSDWIQQTLAPIGNFLALLLSVVVLTGGGVALFLIWYTRGRDPSPGPTPTRLDRPPSNLPAPLAGTLVDEVADVQDAVATLVDLAQRGLLEIADVDNPELAGTSHDVRVTLVDSPDHASLRRYERLLLIGLFGNDAHSKDSVLLSQVRGRFGAVIPALQHALHAAVAEEGFFIQDPDVVRERYRRFGWTILGLGVVACVLGGLTLGWAIGLAWLPGVCLTLIGFALTRIAKGMPRRTAAGALEAARWRAFREHLEHPHPQSGTATRPEDLPYAVAFGIDRSFLQRLENIGWAPPAWYPTTSGWGMPGGMVVVPGGFGGGYGGSPSPQPGNAAPSWPGVPGPQGWSDGLADLLNGASDALSAGGGSGGWSGGGFGGGGGGGGGSGGFQ